MSDIGPEIIVDCSTGKQEARPLTADETAEREALTAEGQAAAAQIEQRRTTQQQIEAAARDAIVTLRQIRDSSPMTNAQAQAAIRELAGNQIRLIRLAVRSLDGAD